ncbi:lipoprotein, partial [Escherichia coli]|nr:lipoprotein [Escherichia coli]
MKKALLVIVTAIVLSGCASSSGKPVEVVNVDRA